MQINKQTHQRLTRYIVLMSVWLTGALLAPILSGAENESPAQAQAAPVDKQQQAPPAETEAGKANTQQAAEQTPAASDTAAKPVKQFKPTDKIGADSAVSFPVDI